MALALESLTFSVETKELENAIQKIKELGQAASSLNKPIEQLAKTATEAGKKVEKAAAASESMAASSSKAKTATESFGKSQEKASSGTDKLQALLDRLTNTYSDLSNGMTRGESNILNAARSFGVLEDQLQPVRKILEQIKELSKDPFDAAIGSVRRISQEFEQFKQRTDLAEKGIFLTTKQLQEYSKIANEIKGKLVSTGVKEGSAEYQAQFNAMLAETNAQYLDYVSKLNAGLTAERERNKQLAEQERLLKQNATAMDAVANRWKQMQAQKADQEANKQLAEQNRLMQQGLTMMDSAVQKYKAGQIAKEQEQLNEQLKEQNRLQQQGATAMDSAVIEFYNRKHQALQDLVKAEQFLATQEEKLQFVTAKTAEGFTVASANALYRYEQSLKKAGVTEQEFIGRSNAYATALKARQDVSDTNARRKAATEELIRIEKQLEDQEKFIAYATAEFSKQQQQATAGTQNFSEALNVGMLRSLFAYEQALRRAGVAEADVVAKSAAMRQQMIQMQQSTESFNGSVNHLGRNIGVQFTDIFVSLYNGQPVMQVITQQGGQLADAFLLAGVSGANMSQHLVDGFKKIMESYKLLGNAFAGLAGTALDSLFGVFGKGMDDMQKALAKTTPDAERFNYVMKGLSETLRASLRSNIILIATAVAAMAVEFLKADFAMDKLNKTLIQYGAALGITAQQGEELAMQVGVATTASIGAARDAILAFAKEGVEVTAEAVAKAVELNDYLGISFEDAAKKAAQFKKEPVEALIEMAKKTGEVDLATLEYVASLELAGNQQQAIKAAIEAKDKAETAAIARAKVGLSGLSELWLVIKQSISNAGDEMVVFLTTSKTLRTIYAGVGAIINTLLYGTAQIYEGWRAIFSVLAAAATGSIDNINASLAESARRMTGVNNDVMKLYDDLYKFATADAKANDDAAEAAARRTQENSKAAGKFQKELALRQQLAKDLGKADADKLSKQAYINASIAEEMRLLGFVTKDQELLNALTKKYGEEWEKANKKTGKPRTSFSTNTGNQIVETSKQFEQRLQLEQRLVANQVKTLENYYEAGLYSMGSFLAQETNAVLASKEKQLQILEEYSRAELAAYDERQAKLEANAAIEIAKGGDRKAIYEQLDRELKNLALSKQTFNEKITGKQETVYSNALKTLSKSMDEISKITGVVTKEVAGFNEELDNQQQARKSDIDFMSQTIGMTEREIAVLKAKNTVIEQSNKLAMKTAKAQAAVEATFWEYAQNIDPMQPEALDKAWGMWQQIQKSKEAMVAAGIRSEEEQRQAMSDAALAYDLANYKKLKDSIADAISTALIEGGKQGRKKLRDIIVAELSKPITLFINAVVNTGLSAIGLNPSIAGAAQSSAGSAVGSLAGNAISSSLGAGAFMGAAGAGASMALSGGMGVALEGGVAMLGSATGFSSAMAGIGQIAGALSPVALGVAALDALTGGNVLSGIGKILGFGDDSPRMYYQTGGGNFEDKVYVDGVYGKIGLADRPSKNVDANSMKDTFQSIADFDAAIAATLDPSQNAKIKKALNNYTSGKNAKLDDYMAARIRIMADEIGGSINELVDEFKGSSNDLIKYMLEITQASTLQEGIRFFNIGLNLTEKQLIAVTVELGRASQGYDKLLATLGSYYNNFFSESEKAANFFDKFAEEIGKAGSTTIPTTKEEFRALVEAQDLSTEAGKTLFNTLMSLQQGFSDATSAAEGLHGIFGELIGEMLVGVDSEISKQLRLTQKASEAAKALASEYSSASKDLKEAAELILFSLKSQQISAKLAYDNAIRKSMAGDVEAMQNLPALASALIEENKKYARSRTEQDLFSAKIASQLQQVSAVADVSNETVNYQAKLYDVNSSILEAIQQDIADSTLTEELIADYGVALENINSLLQASADTSLSNFTDSEGNLKVGIADANGEVFAEISSNTKDQITALYSIYNAVNGLDVKYKEAVLSLDATISTVVNSDIPEDVKTLLLGDTEELRRLIVADFNKGTVDPLVSALALDTSKQVAATVNTAIKTSSISAEVKALALTTTSDVIKSINAVIKTSDETNVIKSLSLDSNASILKNIDVIISSSDLPDELKLFQLGVSTSLTKTIEASISTKGALSQDAREILAITGNYVSKEIVFNVNEGSISEYVAALNIGGGDISKDVNLSVSTSTVDYFTSVLNIGGSSTTTKHGISYYLAGLDWFSNYIANGLNWSSGIGYSTASLDWFTSYIVNGYNWYSGISYSTSNIDWFSSYIAQGFNWTSSINYIANSLDGFTNFIASGYKWTSGINYATNSLDSFSSFIANGSFWYSGINYSAASLDWFSSYIANGWTWTSGINFATNSLDWFSSYVANGWNWTSVINYFTRSTDWFSSYIASGRGWNSSINYSTASVDWFTNYLTNGWNWHSVIDYSSISGDWFVNHIAKGQWWHSVINYSSVLDDGTKQILDLLDGGTTTTFVNGTVTMEFTKSVSEIISSVLSGTSLDSSKLLENVSKYQEAEYSRSGDLIWHVSNGNNQIVSSLSSVQGYLSEQVNQLKILNAQGYLESVYTKQQRAIDELSSSVAAVKSLASAYGVSLRSSSGGAAVFSLDTSTGSYYEDYHHIYGDLSRVYAFRAEARKEGGVQQQLDAASSALYELNTKLEEARQAVYNLGGVPAFAEGGYYSGGVALVGEEGPELINFNQPGQVYTASQTSKLMSSDNSELLEELRSLRTEVQMLRAEARATAVNTSKTARVLDDVTQGGTELRVNPVV